MRTVISLGATGLLLLTFGAIAVASAVDLNSAAATTASSSRGKVTITQQGQWGTNTAEQVVSGTSSNKSGGTGVTELTVEPGFAGDQCFCKITNPQGADSHAIICKAEDAGKKEVLVVELKVMFPASEGEEYSITWEPDKIAVSWPGFISLPVTYANGVAKFQAFTNAPYDGTQGAPTRVAVPVNANGYWEHDKQAPTYYQINNDSGQKDLVGQSATFAVTGSPANITNGVLTHTCYTNLEVWLTKSVAVEYNGAQVFDVSTESWEIYGWKLNVSVTTGS
jgi:hypothetical protein